MRDLNRTSSRPSEPSGNQGCQWSAHAGIRPIVLRERLAKKPLGLKHISGMLTPQTMRPEGAIRAGHLEEIGCLKSIKSVQACKGEQLATVFARQR